MVVVSYLLGEWQPVWSCSTLAPLLTIMITGNFYLGFEFDRLVCYGPRSTYSPGRPSHEVALPPNLVYFPSTHYPMPPFEKSVEYSPPVWCWGPKPIFSGAVYIYFVRYLVDWVIFHSLRLLQWTSRFVTRGLWITAVCGPRELTNFCFLRYFYGQLGLCPFWCYTYRWVSPM